MTSTGSIEPLAGGGGFERPAQILMARGLDEAFEAGFTVLGIGAEHADEGGVDGADHTARIDRGDGDGCGMEQTGESQLGGARLLRFARPAIEDQDMGQIAAAREPVQDAHRQVGAVGLDQVDIEMPRGALGLGAAGAGDQGGAVMGHDLAELQRPVGDLRQVEPEPLRQGGVDIGDVAVGAGGEEAGRRVVEIVDGRLHLGEVRLLAGAVLGDLVHLPDDERALAPRTRVRRHGLDRDAEPARADAGLVLDLAGRRQPELFLETAALLRGAGEPEDRLGEMRIAAEGAVGRRHGGIGIEPQQVAIGPVGVKHPARGIGDQRALRQIVDEGLGQIVTGVALAEIENADGAGE